MSYDILIPFAKRKDTGRIVSVDEVPSGLSCDCICLFCEVEMVARKGVRKAHHFAHKPKDVDEELICQFSLERAIYWMVREVFSELDYIMAPPLTLSYHSKSLCQTFTESVVDGHNIRILGYRFPLEKWLTPHEVIKVKNEHGVNIDIICSFESGDLNINSFPTLYKEGEGLLVIDLNQLLFRLKQLTHGFKDEITEYLQTNIKNKRWAFHPGQVAAEAKIKEKVHALSHKRKSEQTHSAGFP